MKVVVNARFLTQPITGTQRFAIELSLELKNYFPDVVFVTSNRILHHDIAQQLEAVVVGSSKNGLFWEQIELPFFLKKNGNPLLLNFCNVAPVFYSNNVVSVLDLSFHHHPEWFSKVFSTLYNTLIPLAAKKARHIVTISEYSRQDISNVYKIPIDKISLIYPTIPKIFFNQKNNVTSSLYSKYILAVSSLDPRKNFLGLIKAFKALNIQDLKLVIVGSQHKVFADNSLKEVIDGNSNIVFTGYVDDITLYSLYKNALLFAYPSFFEGFGIPPLEAMVCGCPTLVSNTTSLPEVCGDASIYVDPHDLQSIQNGIKIIYHDDLLRKQLIIKGFERVKLFSTNNSAKILVNLINQLLQDKLSQ